MLIDEKKEVVQMMIDSEGLRSLIYQGQETR